MLKIRRMGYTQTARRFQAINEKLKGVGQGKSLQERINERGKLVKQIFGSQGHLIVAGAGRKTYLRSGSSRCCHARSDHRPDSLLEDGHRSRRGVVRLSEIV